MTPPDPELSGQIGELRGSMRALESRITEMVTHNAHEHGEVKRSIEGLRVDLNQAMDGIRRDLNDKASVARVDNHAARIRELEGKGRQDAGELSGSARTLKLLQGAGMIGLAVLTYLAGKGGL